MCVYVCMPVSKCTCLCMCTYVCTVYVFMLVCVYVCMFVFVSMFVWPCCVVCVYCVICYSYNPEWVWYPCYFMSWGRALITRISYECIWVITSLLPKRLYQSMLSLWPVSNDFRLCSPIKASFVTNNLFLWFFLEWYLLSPRTDK